jgi:hypothetical protein
VECVKLKGDDPWTYRIGFFDAEDDSGENLKCFNTDKFGVGFWNNEVTVIDPETLEEKQVIRRRTGYIIRESLSIPYIREEYLSIPITLSGNLLYIDNKLFSQVDYTSYEFSTQFLYAGGRRGITEVLFKLKCIGK